MVEARAVEHDEQAGAVQQLADDEHQEHDEPGREALAVAVVVGRHRLGQEPAAVEPAAVEDASAGAVGAFAVVVKAGGAAAD